MRKVKLGDNQIAVTCLQKQGDSWEAVKTFSVLWNLNWVESCSENLHCKFKNKYMSHKRGGEKACFCLLCSLRRKPPRGSGHWALLCDGNGDKSVFMEDSSQTCLPWIITVFLWMHFISPQFAKWLPSHQKLTLGKVISEKPLISEENKKLNL